MTCDFNPRTRAGCDPVATVAGIISVGFQSTHPRGVRQQTYTKAHCCLRFQYTFSTNTCQFFGSCLLFFSTLSTYLAIPRCEPTGEFLSAWTSHRPKMRVKLRYFKSRKKANQNRVCQFERGKLARKSSPSTSALCVHSKSQRRGSSSTLLPLQLSFIPATNRPIGFVPGERPDR